MRFKKLAPGDPLPKIDHVLVAKLDPNRFEVSGTGDARKPRPAYLAATAHATQASALAQAEEFARTHGLKVIHVKGFTPRAAGP
jgi:hypothetical protein